MLPEPENYRDVDLSTPEWGERFNLINIGRVDSKFTLFKVNNQ